MTIEPCTFTEVSATEYAAAFPDFHAPDIRIRGDAEGWHVIEIVSNDGDAAPHMDEVFDSAEEAKAAVYAQAKAEGLGD